MPLSDVLTLILRNLRLEELIWESCRLVSIGSVIMHFPSLIKYKKFREILRLQMNIFWGLKVVGSPVTIHLLLTSRFGFKGFSENKSTWGA